MEKHELIDVVSRGSKVRRNLNSHLLVGKDTYKYMRGDILDANATYELINQQISQSGGGSQGGGDQQQKESGFYYDNIHHGAGPLVYYNAKDNTYKYVLYMIAEGEFPKIVMKTYALVVTDPSVFEVEGIAYERAAGENGTLGVFPENALDDSNFFVYAKPIIKPVEDGQETAPIVSWTLDEFVIPIENTVVKPLQDVYSPEYKIKVMPRHEYESLEPKDPSVIYMLYEPDSQIVA